MKIGNYQIEMDRKEEYTKDEPKDVLDRVFTVVDEERWGEKYTIFFREYVDEPTLLYWIEDEDDELIEHKAVQFNCRGKVIGMTDHSDMVIECLKAQGFLLAGSIYDVYR